MSTASSLARRGSCLAVLLLCVASSRGQDDARPRVLMLTHSAGYRHGVVTRPVPDAPSHAERAFLAAADGRYDVVATQSVRPLTRAGLAEFDAVVFCTTGELPVAEEERDAVVDWVVAGGAFVGAHCASDTWYEHPTFLDMVGGAFDGHPWHHEVDLRVEDRDHAATRHLDKRWTLTDEIYQFRDFQRHPTEVLLTLEDGKADLAKGKRADGDYAVAWCRPYGQGRVFYTALGHRPEVWDSPAFRQHLLGGLHWALHGPDRPTPPPPGARRLFDGTSAGPETWQRRPGHAGREALWRAEGDVLHVVPGTGDHLSRSEFGDQLLHVEFMTPDMPHERGQGKGNSGVYVQARYEVQVLDSFGVASGDGDCAAIYGVAPPARNACRRPERWQSYDIRFRAPRFDASGAKTEDARMSVWHNGVPVHVDVAVPAPTPAAAFGDEQPRGPLMLQDHGNPVRYRNIWVLPLDAD